MLRRSKDKVNKVLTMKIEFNLSPAAEIAVEGLLRPAQVNELQAAARPVASVSAAGRLNLLARRQARQDRRANR
ncbi:MAG: hypothetical protein Q8S09_10780 [Hyphomonas sp.]|nr:hypothetical protein [Hyphomonas sp.]